MVEFAAVNCCHLFPQHTTDWGSLIVSPTSFSIWVIEFSRDDRPLPEIMELVFPTDRRSYILASINNWVAWELDATLTIIRSTRPSEDSLRSIIQTTSDGGINFAPCVPATRGKEALINHPDSGSSQSTSAKNQYISWRINEVDQEVPSTYPTVLPKQKYKAVKEAICTCK